MRPVPPPTAKQAYGPAPYFAVALLSAAILAYELFLMRVFANSGWSHFGSTVISIAMFGFGVFSTILCIGKSRFDRHHIFWLHFALLLLGPAMVAANSLAQTVPFNPIFLVSDPAQKYYLGCYFLLYFIPFFLGAMFLGLFFVQEQHRFSTAYFANMTGSGLGGLALFCGMYFLLPERLFLVPLLLWFAGALLWLLGQDGFKLTAALVIGMALSLAAGWVTPQVAVSPYKGVSYARKLPGAHKVCERVSPFGLLEVYGSTYFHFAPGLSDAATLYLEQMPENAYLGMYLDGDGPMGIMKHLPPEQAAYLKFLPPAMPYLLKTAPEVLVMQFGGGISTQVGLSMGAGHITVAEGNPLVVEALRDDDFIAGFTGHILANPKVRLISNEGRITVGQAQDRFDLIDLSLADSTGLSMPGGASIHEKYAYTRETLQACIRALHHDGILAVTVWNKEAPPKSTIKVLNTIIQAAHDAGSADPLQDFFITHTYLSTITVLYKKGGFTGPEIQTLAEHCRKMSFELLYFPGQSRPPDNLDRVLAAYHDAFFGSPENDSPNDAPDLSAGQLYRLAIGALLQGDSSSVENGYLFDNQPLTNNRPYLAGYVKLRDLPRVLDNLEAVSDDWGYLLLWATLLLSLGFALVLMLLPVLFGWRAFFAGHRGRLGIVLYFLCLGIGYILVEVTMISKYVLPLGNTTVSVTLLVTGMLVFSGLGSYAAGRFVDRAAPTVTTVCAAIGLLLLVYSVGLDPLFMRIGGWAYGAKMLTCLCLLFPLAFLLGFPFTLGMATLAHLNKDRFFVWAWGINGSFSVVGSALVPVISVTQGLSTAMLCAALLYAAAIPAFLQLRLPDISSQEA
jgi:hypothetical protein